MLSRLGPTGLLELEGRPLAMGDAPEDRKASRALGDKPDGEAGWAAGNAAICAFLHKRRGLPAGQG